MAVPNTFAAATSAIPLANLDANFAYYDAAYSITSTAISFTGAVTLSTGTVNGVPYLNASKVLTSGSVLTFDGTILSSTRFAGALNGTVGATTANTGAFTTLTTSSTVTLNGGTANGVAYLNGSKVLTTGSALTFDGAGSLVSGVGGSGTNNSVLKLNGSDASSYGSYIQFQRNGVNKWTIGTDSGINGGTSDDLTIFGTASQRFYASSAEGMRLTSTGLGIGTSSPGAKLHVSTGTTTNALAGNAVAGFTSSANAVISFNVPDANAAGLFFGYGGNAYWAGMERDGTTGLRFTVAGNEMRLDSSGNLGLGVTPSAWTLGGAKALQVGPYAALTSYNAGVTDLCHNLYGGYSYLTSNPASFYRQVSGQHQWFRSTSAQVAGTDPVFSQAMTLDASGNLGIGTTSPSFALDISQVAPRIRQTATTGTNSTLIQLVNTGGTAYIGLDSSGGGLGGAYSLNLFHGGAYPIVFSTSGSERARIDASGNLLVGTTAALYAVGERLSVQGASGKIGQTIQATGASSIGLLLASDVATGATSAKQISFVNSGGVEVGSVTSNGTATLFNTTSDQRLKENIQDAAPASDLIDAIKVRQYDWKSDGSHQRYGFVAQELVTVAPEAVHQPTNPEEMMAVDYSKLVPMLVKEIQDLRKRLAAAGI